MNEKPNSGTEELVPRKMSLLGPKTAAERAARTLRKNWTMPSAATITPAPQPAEPETVALPPEPTAVEVTPSEVQVLDEPTTSQPEVAETLPTDKKSKKDKKKKSKKKKTKDKQKSKKSKGKKDAK
ncbi:hypothetical protein [Magnetovibrio sp.]|uniref:hypothetical protein n=1 Tax=Magnetovibrio sp. TaxID=2024836 RepID=UPI002F933B21